jgi:hypothetical protein
MFISSVLTHAIASYFYISPRYNGVSWYSAIDIPLLFHSQNLEVKRQFQENAAMYYHVGYFER